MQAELDLIRNALQQDLGIVFEVLIAFIIPRTPTDSMFGDSFIRECGGYSTTLQVWWYLTFPDTIVQRTLLHLKDNKDKTFFLINCLEYVMIINNYCAAITAFLDSHITNNPHPVVLCVTDNVSAKNWMMHTSKRSINGQALAWFFCRLLIGSDFGINTKWISTFANKIEDKISRIKKSNSSTPSSFHYDFSNLVQNHAGLKHHCFFQTSSELLSMIWKILLMQRLPDLNKVPALKQQGFGKLNT
jgi:hypothetical protein